MVVTITTPKHKPFIAADNSSVPTNHFHFLGVVGLSPYLFPFSSFRVYQIVGKQV